MEKWLRWLLDYLPRTTYLCTKLVTWIKKWIRKKREWFSYNVSVNIDSNWIFLFTALLILSILSDLYSQNYSQYKLLCWVFYLSFLLATDINKKRYSKTQQEHFFPVTMPQLLRIFHRPVISFSRWSVFRDRSQWKPNCEVCSLLRLTSILFLEKTYCFWGFICICSMFF